MNEANVSKPAKAEHKHKCSYCGHEWHGKGENKDVLCPLCNHLSTDVMEKYFSNGYAEGVKHIFIKSGKTQIWLSVLSLIGAVIAVFIAYKIFTRDSDTSFLYTASALLCSGLTLWGVFEFVTRLAIYMKYIKNHNSFIDKSDSVSDKDLLDIIIDCYQKDKNYIRYNYNWLNTLMKNLL